MSVVYKYNYYEIKDRYLNKRFGKRRYCMLKPEQLFRTVSQYKKIMSQITESSIAKILTQIYNRKIQKSYGIKERAR